MYGKNVCFIHSCSFSRKPSIVFLVFFMFSKHVPKIYITPYIISTFMRDIKNNNVPAPKKYGHINYKRKVTES